MSIILNDKSQSLVKPRNSNPYKDRKNPYDVQSVEELTSNPHARNPVYLFKDRDLRLECPYEQGCSSLKRYKNGLSLYWHITHEHWNESDKRIRIQKVAEKIIEIYGDKIVEGLRE